MRSSASRNVALPTLLAIVAAGALVPLNSTMIAVALPEIADNFDIASGSAGVLITVYLVTMLVGQPLSGRLSDRVGPKRVVIVALCGVAFASVVGAMAGSFTVLVAARILMAAFASALSPGIHAMLRSITDSANRGRSFGILGSAMGVGAASGPIVGGAVIALFGWNAVFLVNLPVIGVVLVLLHRYSRSTNAQPDSEPLRNAEERRELQRKPRTERERVLNPVFRTCFAVQALTTLTQYTFLLVVPVILDERGWGPGRIGLALSFLTAGMIVSGPIGGKLGDRSGRRRPVLLGLGAASLATVVAASQGSDIRSELLIASIAVVGLGLGMATPSVVTAAVESVPESRSATAAGLFGTGRYVGSIPASVMVAVVLSDGVNGITGVLSVAAFAALAALAVSRHLPSSPLS